AAGGVGASAGRPGLTPLASVRFPYRAFVLTTSKPVGLDSGSVVVRENGQPVNGVSVIRATSAKTGTFGAVLVIDASDSMRGAAIGGAMKAARVFASHKAAGASLCFFSSKRRHTSWPRDWSSDVCSSD